VSHIQESKAEYVQDEMNYGKTAVAHLEELGVLDRRFGLVHAVWLSNDDLDVVTRTECSVITNPVSNLRLGNGIAPVRELMERGAHVALGTDGPTANDSANLFEGMKMLAIIQRIASPDFRRWPKAVDVLRVATSGGAYAFGEADSWGSIEVGKRADLTLLNRSDIAYVPFHRPISQLVYADTGSSVDIVIVDGEIVVEDGRVTRIPREEILDAFREAYAQVIPAVDEAARQSSRYEPYVEDAYRRSAAVPTDVNPVLWRGEGDPGD
jgi:5-methylthioadenosine/S-adenosylhomocysteine deaminase